jgi:hypothetical protein
MNVGRENIFKLTIGNETLLKISNGIGVRIVNFAQLRISQSKVQCYHIATFINIFGWENPKSD